MIKTAARNFLRVFAANYLSRYCYLWISVDWGLFNQTLPRRAVAHADDVDSLFAAFRALGHASCSFAIFLFCLSVSFHPVVGLAEHLAILDGGFAALAPRRYMVGIHFVELINLSSHILLTFSTFRTI